jgi:glycosyltransferase involved in cell wall biosynthesis
MTVQVDILLATYNGGKYLHELIDSIISQSLQSWRLLIRDDGSTDKTLSILSQYAEKFPNNIKIVNDAYGRLGPAKSFERLLFLSSAPYVAFCDQDDVWLPDKLKVQMNAMLDAEPRLPNNCPLLVHTDMLVVDKNMNVLSKSFWKYQNINPANMTSLQRLLIQNHVTGCAILINRSLADISVPVPANAKMHDWWIALVAIVSGKIVWVEHPTVMYRQHDANDTGAKKWGISYYVNVIMSDKGKLRNDLLITRDQAKALLSIPVLNQQTIREVKRYVDLYEMGWIKKRYTMIKYGYLKYGLIRNIGLFLFA